ncbi:MAG: 16S rRNA (cytosine(1402)-N(4))-methyltransferase, partial [Candidatus Roizmanbacteria bacterium]
IFQALFIEVNHEKQSITEGLEGAGEIVQKGGKILTLSFHSIHDRLVKTWIRKHNLKSIKKEVKRKLKSFERSAVLRITTV